ncbi:hypothetical protein [Streptomyces sp. NPDC094031]|uniref:hypothetical protein n=1 Tax=Streptomyces sp. NPDC094031 TaxID=3155307 RepID=UPI00332C181E
MRAAEATSRGEIVVLDVGGRPPAELAGLPAADLTVLTDNYRARDWVQVDFVDRRPEQIRVFAALDKRFARWWRPSTEQIDADRLRTALDREFFYYAMLRLEAPDEVDVYDVDDAEDVEEWWDLGADGTPGHPRRRPAARRRSTTGPVAPPLPGLHHRGGAAPAPGQLGRGARLLSRAQPAA